MRSRIGRAFVAMRDGEIAAEALGIDLAALQGPRVRIERRSTPVLRAGSTRPPRTSWRRRASTSSRWSCTKRWSWSAGSARCGLGPRRDIARPAAGGVAGVQGAAGDRLRHHAARFRDLFLPRRAGLALSAACRAGRSRCTLTDRRRAERARARAAARARSRPTSRHAHPSASVSSSFGGVQVLSDVELEAAPGEIVGIIGPNGAGKTTLLNVICGIHRARRRRDRTRRPAAHRPQAQRDRRPRPRADVPDLAALPRHDRAREHDGRAAPRHTRGPFRRRIPHRAPCARRRRGWQRARARRCASSAWSSSPTRPGNRALLRPATHRRDRAHADQRARVVLARRAGGRAEPQPRRRVRSACCAASATSAASRSS